MIRNVIGNTWKKLPRKWRQRLTRAANDKFTVSAAVAVLNESGEILLLDHVLRPGSGWGLPGGFLHHGEQPDSGIRREIREEIGLELDDVQLISVVTHSGHIEILYAARPVGEPRVLTREIKGFRWFPPDELPEGVTHGQRGFIEHVSAHVDNL
ncbi:MAG: NUDIX domain-containing protein [Acidobacteria bacterium]|nr:NUDIX domain-containing protein [Acidobacteriota bacterium]MCA1608858.1 NUDIX domain-containing protein [Acidobacteriota bacterium]